MSVLSIGLSRPFRLKISHTKFSYKSIPLDILELTSILSDSSLSNMFASIFNFLNVAFSLSSSRLINVKSNVLIAPLFNKMLHFIAWSGMTQSTILHRLCLIYFRKILLCLALIFLRQIHSFVIIV